MHSHWILIQQKRRFNVMLAIQGQTVMQQKWQDMQEQQQQL